MLESRNFALIYKPSFFRSSSNLLMKVDEYNSYRFDGNPIPTKYTTKFLNPDEIQEIGNILNELESFQDYILGKNKRCNLIDLWGDNISHPTFVDLRDPRRIIQCKHIRSYLKKWANSFLNEKPSGPVRIQNIIRTKFPEPELLLDKVGREKPNYNYLEKNDFIVQIYHKKLSNRYKELIKYVLSINS